MNRIVFACLVVTASLGVAIGLTQFHSLGVAHAQPTLVLPAPPAADPPAAGSGSATLPSDQLHDPLSAPAAAFDDLKAAKKIGWVVAVLAGLILLTRLLSRLGGVFTFLAKGKVAVIAAGIGTTAAAAYNALLLEGSWVAALAAGLLTLATVFDAAVRPKQ